MMISLTTSGRDPIMQTEVKLKNKKKIKNLELLDLHADDEEVEGDDLQKVLLVLAQHHQSERVSIQEKSKEKKSSISFFLDSLCWFLLK